MCSGGWAIAGFRAYLSIREDEEAPNKAIIKGPELNVDSDDIANQCNQCNSDDEPTLKRHNKRGVAIGVIRRTCFVIS